MPGDRRVLARLVGRYVGTTRGVFELGDGRHVEAGGVVGFDSAEAPEIGGKALVVMDESGGALSWEPYAGARPPSPRGPRLSRGSSSLEGRRPRVSLPKDTAPTDSYPLSLHDAHHVGRRRRAGDGTGR